MGTKHTNDSKFFQNTECEYFPCHESKDTDNFNCQFCFCPLYFLQNCGGEFKFTDKGIKDCKDCLVPHIDREQILNRIKKENSLSKNRAIAE